MDIEIIHLNKKRQSVGIRQKKRRKTTLIVGRITSDSKWKMLNEHYNSIEYLHNA